MLLRSGHAGIVSGLIAACSRSYKQQRLAACETLLDMRLRSRRLAAAVLPVAPLLLSAPPLLPLAALEPAVPLVAPAPLFAPPLLPPPLLRLPALAPPLLPPGPAPQSRKI
jgi:hypothetical protein